MTFLDGIRGRLRRGRGEADLQGDLARARKELAAAGAHLQKLQSEHEKLNARLAAVEAKLTEARAALRASRSEAARWRRRVLSSRVLRDLLPARRAQIPARGGARAAAEREARLLQMSDAYAQAITGNPTARAGVASSSTGSSSTVLSGAASSGAIRTELDGLTWWVPAGGDASRWTEKAVRERLPYRGLIHAREVCTGGVMLDLGAHNGSTAIPRVILGDVEACYCAEPDPANYDCLVANVVDNGLRGLVLPDRVAIGASEGTARLAPHKSSRGHHLSEAGTIEVRMRTLDRWVDDLGIDPRAISFVKSDIQGYELAMLKGAPRLLACRHIAWQLEFAPRLLAAAGGTPRDFYSVLESHFTHFIDLNAGAAGRRVRPIADVAAALDYVERGEKPHTDLILYSTY